MEKEKLAIETLRKLHSITADHSLDIDQKIQHLLRLGKETFELPLALVSHIHDDKYVVKYADTPNGEVNPGDEFELGITYCIHTLNANGPTAFDHAATSDICQHPCYSAFGLESYIGVPLIVSGERYGTVNFSSPDIHDVPFSENDLELIRLFAQWIGNELTRKQIDESFKRQQGLLESMSQLARIGAWELDLEKETVYWSSMTKEIHEVDADFVPDLATGINFYKEGYSRDRITEVVQKGMETGQPWSEDLQLVTAKGNEIWVTALGQAELKDGKCVRLYGSFQDIDKKVKAELELKEAKEKAEEAAHSKSVFLANMSHEIRTPMNGVYGMLSALENAELDESASRQVGIAKNSAESLLTLINDILDFSKVDAGHLELEQVDFNLEPLMRDFTESMRFQAEERGLSLTLDIGNLAHSWVNGDPSRVRQILTNIVSNAIKFTDQGHVAIKTLIKPMGAHSVFSCVVTDTGIGIPSDKLEDLFNPFTQADSSTTRKYGGTGLGLAIVKQLCELMGGWIKAESLENQGSKFEFELFLKPTQSAAAHTASEEETSPLSLNTEAKLLLVEDNKVNQLVAQELLKQLGLKADLAENGLEALSQLQDASPPYDLVLMDCQMPEMDGYEATRSIRNDGAGAGNSNIKIIALTANAMKGDREKCLEAGMDDYLSKPIIRDELESKLAKCLKETG